MKFREELNVRFYLGKILTKLSVYEIKDLAGNHLLDIKYIYQIVNVNKHISKIDNNLYITNENYLYTYLLKYFDFYDEQENLTKFDNYFINKNKIRLFILFINKHIDKEHKNFNENLKKVENYTTKIFNEKLQYILKSLEIYDTNFIDNYLINENDIHKNTKDYKIKMILFNILEEKEFNNLITDFKFKKYSNM